MCVVGSRLRRKDVVEGWNLVCYPVNCPAYFLVKHHKLNVIPAKAGTHDTVQRNATLR